MQVDFSNISVLTFLGVYAAGVLTSFTPCLYPIIPITVAYIGAKSAGSRSRGFLLSVFYVLGLSAVYSIFGLAAALTGRLFGSVASNPMKNAIRQSYPYGSNVGGKRTMRRQRPLHALQVNQILLP